ncbi:MAG: peptidyl-prolyl cis-trans isomerase [Armatimonadota bacterium]
MRGARFAVAATVLAALAFGLAWAQEVPDPVATVNRQPISRSHFQRELLRRQGPYVLKALALELLVGKRAQDAGVSVSDDEVEDRLEELAVAKILRSPALRARHLRGLYPALDPDTAENRWREDTRLQLLIEKTVEKTAPESIAISDEDITRFWEEYEDTSPLINRPEGRRISIIVTEDMTDAKAAHSRVTNMRGQWHEMCRKYSIDPLSKHKGGDFGPYVRILPGREPGRFEEAVFDLKKVGDISDVTYMPPLGYVILRLDEIQPARKFDFDEVKEVIRDNLRLLKLRREAQLWMTQGAWENAQVDVKIGFETETGIPQADPVAVITLRPEAEAPGTATVATGEELPLARDLFLRELIRRSGPLVLRQLVLEAVVHQHADRADLQVTDAEVRQRIERMAEQNGLHTMGLYVRYLAATYPGLELAASQKRLEEDTRLQLLIEKLVAADVKVEDREVIRFYEQYNKTSPLISQPEGRRVSVIITEQRADADKALGELRAAPDRWGEVCRQYSEDALTRDRAGDFGRYLRKPPPAERADAFLTEVFRLEKPGTISGVITPPWGGYAIVRLDDIRPAQDLAFDDCKDLIRATLLAEKIQRRAETWMAQDAWQGVDLDVKIKFGDT